MGLRVDHNRLGVVGIIDLYELDTGLHIMKRNLITNRGLEILKGGLFGRKWFKLDTIIVTDNTTTPAITDVMANFCLSTDNWYGSRLYTNDLRHGIDCTAFFTTSEANFTWKKIGLIDKNQNLICESLFTYVKSASTRVQVSWKLTLEEI